MWNFWKTSRGLHALHTVTTWAGGLHGIISEPVSVIGCWNVDVGPKRRLQNLPEHKQLKGKGQYLGSDASANDKETTRPCSFCHRKSWGLHLQVPRLSPQPAPCPPCCSVPCLKWLLSCCGMLLHSECCGAQMVYRSSASSSWLHFLSKRRKRGEGTLQ